MRIASRLLIVKRYARPPQFNLELIRCRCRPCPATLGGHKVPNWDLYEGARPLPQKLAGDGAAQVKEIMLAPSIRHCLNRKESRAFDRNVFGDNVSYGKYRIVEEANHL